MKVQYMSDLHLEIAPGFRIENAAAEILVLAGDIGDPATTEYEAFLSDCSMKFREVFVVIGNHEAYGKTWVDTLRAVERVAAQFVNVFILDRSSRDVVPEKLRIAGATLWSDVPTLAAHVVRRGMNDFRRIKGMTLGLMQQLHREDVAFIEHEIERARSDGIGLLVATHHAPSFRGTSHPMFDDDDMKYAFATNLDRLIGDPVVGWVHGHTHYSHRTGLVMSNQRGYVHEARDTKFDADEFIEFS